MKNLLLSTVTVLGLLTVLKSDAAPQAKTYQVTGPVVAVTEAAITVKKGEDQWQIARDAGTKIKGALQVGEKVTIQYRMVATEVEVKGEKK